MARPFQRAYAFFRPSRPRSPWLRFGLALLGLVLLVPLLIGGVVVGGVLLVSHLLLKSRKAAAKSADATVLDAEYTVVRRDNARLGAQRA